MKKGKFKFNVLYFILFVILFLYTISMMLPMLWGLFTSLKSHNEFMLGNTWKLPQNWEFKNYAEAFTKFEVTVTLIDKQVSYDLISMMLNSIIYSLGCAAVSTFTCCVVAYVVAKFDFKFLKTIHGVVIVVMILPIVGNLPSSLQVARALGLYDNLLGMFIRSVSFTNIYFLIFYSSFKGLSSGYAEAAKLDGASNFTIMCKVMIPLVMPTVSAVMIMSFINCWNDYYTPMIYLPSMPVVAYGLYLYRFGFGQGTSSITMQISGCMLVMLPILIFYLVLQHKITENLTVGGLKG